MPSPEERVFLDACCLINLFATGCAEEIFVGLPYRFAVARYVVEDEVLHVASGEEEPGRGARRSVHPRLRQLIDQQVLEQADISTADEKRELVRFAVDLDDGEAHTCALALLGRNRVATDDRKAIRVYTAAWEEAGAGRDREPRSPCIRTSELLFTWADTRGVPEAEQGRIVRSIARRASFIPPRDDPHIARWLARLYGEKNEAES